MNLLRVALQVSLFAGIASSAMIMSTPAPIAAAATEKLARAVKLKPESSEAHAALADAYQQDGQSENADRERGLAVQLTRQPHE